MARRRSPATPDGRRGRLRDAPLRTGPRSAARPPAAVSPLVRARPARENRGSGQYAYCTGRCTRRTRAAALGHGTPHRREKVVTDGLDQPPPLRAACTSATARTASQGQLLPSTGTLQRAPALPTDKCRGPRPPPPTPRLSAPPVSAPKTHPRAHRDTREGRTHVRGRRPMPEEDHRPPPASRASQRRHEPAAPAARGTPPEAPRPALHPAEASAPRLHPAVQRAQTLRGEAPGADDHTRLARRAPPPSPGEAGSGRRCMRRLCTMPPPSSAGAPSCAALPAVGRRPCPTVTPPSRAARTGGQGTRAPTPAPGAVYVSYVCHAPVCPLPALTHSLDPRPPWPPTSALRQAPPAPRHALKPGEGPPGRAPAATPCGYGGSGAPGGPFPSTGRLAAL